MIKFKCLIHKQTGTVIKYEDWKEATQTDNFITINKEKKVFVNPKNIFKAKEMLFSDDFEIIYNSEFTTEELDVLYSCVGVAINEYECSDCECKEEYNLLDKIEVIKNRYINQN